MRKKSCLLAVYLSSWQQVHLSSIISWKHRPWKHPWKHRRWLRSDSTQGRAAVGRVSLHLHSPGLSQFMPVFLASSLRRAPPFHSHGVLMWLMNEKRWHTLCLLPEIPAPVRSTASYNSDVPSSWKPSLMCSCAIPSPPQPRTEFCPVTDESGYFPVICSSH